MSLTDDMLRTFGCPPRFWADIMFYVCGVLILDPLVFEQFLKRHHGYSDLGETFESINEFVGRKWGKEALALLDRASKGEQRQPNSKIGNSKSKISP